MKRYYILLTLFALFGLAAASCTDDPSPETQAKKKGVEIFFEEELHDYGEIAQDSDGTWSFTFKNIGEESLIINRVRSTCGCTIPSWPKEPLEAGSEGEIVVKYNTANAGPFTKSVYVYSSAANSPVKLMIKGKVLRNEEEK